MVIINIEFQIMAASSRAVVHKMHNFTRLDRNLEVSVSTVIQRLLWLRTRCWGKEDKQLIIDRLTSGSAGQRQIL